MVNFEGTYMQLIVDRSFWDRDRVAFWIKWTSSVIQILGYSATAFGITPLNIYFFLVGLIGWFVVGVLWNDRALMLIHLVALGAMLIGMLY